MLEETMEYLEKRQSLDPSFTYEVLVVNDGSPDNTSQVHVYNHSLVFSCILPTLFSVRAQEALKFVRQYGCDKVRLLVLDQNRGKGGAVRMVS